MERENCQGTTDTSVKSGDSNRPGKPHNTSDNTRRDYYGHTLAGIERFTTIRQKGHKDNQIVQKIVVSSRVLGYRDICQVSFTIDSDVLSLLPKVWKDSEEVTEFNVELLEAFHKMLLRLVSGIPSKGCAPFSHSLDNQGHIEVENEGGEILGKNIATQLRF